MSAGATTFEPAVAAVRVVLVEDDEILARGLIRVLRGAGLDARHVPDGRSLLAAHQDGQCDVVILDLGLPDLDGLDVLRRLRAGSDVPVIVLSGRSGEVDRVVGLDLGANDYVVKPAYPTELAARVRAVVRARRVALATASEVRRFGDLVLDVAARTVTLAGVLLELPPKEFDLLAHLTARPDRACSRAELLREVWDSSPAYQDPATVTEHVGRLRRRLGSGPDRPWIVTARGVGYRFVG